METESSQEMRIGIIMGVGVFRAGGFTGKRTKHLQQDAAAETGSSSDLSGQPGRAAGNAPQAIDVQFHLRHDEDLTAEAKRIPYEFLAASGQLAHADKRGPCK